MKINEKERSENLALVRTKLQAYILSQLIVSGEVSPPKRIWVITTADERVALSSILMQLNSVTQMSSTPIKILRRDKHWHFSLVLRIWTNVLRLRISKGALIFANLNWIALALPIKLMPAIRYITFDDGTANIQRRRGSYLSDLPTARTGVLGRILKKMFPSGCAGYLRGRSSLHFTMFRDCPQSQYGGQVVHIPVDWENLIGPDDTSQLPDRVCRIYLGTVTKEIDIDMAIHAALLSWADFYIPHPRSCEPGVCSRIILKYPAEALIAHYAKSHLINVAHYNSTAALGFSEHSNVQLFDITKGEIPRRELPSETKA